MEVPLSSPAAVSPVLMALRIAVPGAATLTNSPQLELLARTLSICKFATLMMHVGRAAVVQRSRCKVQQQQQ
jgi:hypothetical protein